MKNIISNISNILNRISGQSAAVTSTAAPIVTSTAAPTVPATTTAAPIAKAYFVQGRSASTGAPDAGDEEYTNPPYLKGRWRCGQFSTAPQPEMTRPILEIIIQQAGGPSSVFPQNEVEELGRINDKWKNLADQFSRNSFLAVGEIFREQMNRISPSLLEGKTPPPIQSREEILLNVQNVRAACHELRKDLSAEIYEIYARFCLRMRDGAGEFVEERKAREIAESKAMGIAFVPSPVLLQFVFFAVVAAGAPVQNFHPGGVFINSGNDPKTLWYHWITTLVEPDIDPGRKPEQISEGKRMLDAMTTAQREQQERAHREKIIELNKWHDQIRTQEPK